MRIGNLRRRLELQHNTDTQTGTGEIEKSWTTYDTVWGSVEAMSGRELMAADQIRSTATIMVTIRFRTDVLPEDRITYGTRTLEINSVLDPDGRRRTLKLSCSEVVL